MKKLFLFSALALLAFSSCEKDDLAGGACDLPHNAAPAALKGGWASGFNNMTQVLDAYSGHFEGYTWESAKYFSFTNNGKGAEFYYMAKGQYAQTSTHAAGTIEFDDGSDAESGSFVFHACKAHYRGWGSNAVDRDATDDELQNNLTRRYYYVMDGNWLRIEPGSEPNEYTSSFKKVN